MKRYKVISFENTKYTNTHLSDFFKAMIECGTEIVLEEVKEECDCITEPCMHSPEVLAFNTSEKCEHPACEEEKLCDKCDKSFGSHSTIQKAGIQADISSPRFICDQPKEEKEKCKKCERGIYRICYGGKGKCEFNCDCHDQPLTPKDVGMRKGESYEKFRIWINGFDGNLLWQLSDELFESKFQQFLSEYKK